MAVCAAKSYWPQVSRKTPVIAPAIASSDGSFAVSAFHSAIASSGRVRSARIFS
jgi:hypothetical protein